MKTKFLKSTISLLLSVCLFCSLLICIMAVPASADAERMLVWDNVGFYSRLHYRPNTGDFVAGKKYVYSFDYDNLTKTDESNFWGVFYRATEVEDKNAFKRIPHANLDIKKTEVANGNHYDITFTVPDDCYAKDNILFKYGDITSNGYVQNMRIGNLDLWELDNNDKKVKQIKLTLPDSISDVSIVKTDNDVKYYGYVGKWMGIYAYMNGISLAEQNSYFEPEIVNPFAEPENTLRFYEGGKKVYVEYVDNSVNLAAGEYIFGCKYKTFGTTPDFEVYTSENGGATYAKAALTLFDSRRFNRSAKFKLTKKANAVKIVIGNTGESVDKSLAMAGAFLAKSNLENQLVAELNAANINVVGLNADNANKKWNVHTDADNAGAVEIFAYDPAYFAPLPAGKVYQNVAGKQFSYVIYKNNSFVAEKNKEYILTADYKVLSGTFDSDDVSSTAVLDPAFRVKVGNYVLENAKSTYFTVLNSHFDELTGKLYIRFSSPTKRTKLEIIAGNYNANSVEGACAVGNVNLCECFTKADGDTVYKDNIIDNITEESLNEIKNGTAEPADLKWNAVYTSTKKEYSITDYSAAYFKASPAMVEINEGAKGARISYTDSALKLTANKTYKLQFNYKKTAGNPEFSFAAKNIGGTAGTGYSEITEKADFISVYNEEFDSNTYLKTVTFRPKQDIADIRILIGNIDANNDSGVIFANPELCAIDNNGVAVGGNLLSDMIKPNIKRDSDGQNTWNLNADATKIEVTAPIKNGVFLQKKMIKIEPNSAYNRVEYYDKNLELVPGNTYRFSVDCIVYGGNPTFSLAYYNKETKAYTNVRNISVDGKFNSFLDKENNIRGIEFKVKPLSNDELANIGDIRIMIGNGGEAKDISIVFANPQMYVISDGNPVGENLVNPITDDTVLYMTSERNYDGLWDLRYQGAKGGAVKLLEIPENYFRSPVLVVKNGDAVMSQTVTVKPNKNYRLSYYVKTNAGSIKPYIKGITNAGAFTDITVNNELIDNGGYYSYSCEFKSPSSLKSKNNLRVGVSFDNAAEGAICNFQLYELNSGFEPIGGNIIVNGDFTDSKNISAYTDNNQVGWTFEGTLGDTAVSARATGYFAIPTSKMFIFVGGSAGNYLSRTETIAKGKTYELSFNLKYANPGYEGDSGVEIQYLTAGDVWKKLNCTDKSPAKEFKKVYEITLPADAADTNNFRFTVLAGSSFVSGYIANASLVDISDKETNLLYNGDFSDGLLSWNTDGSFANTYFTDIPEGYFDNPQTNKPGMIVYRNSGSWENFYQTYLNLKPDSYYLFKANAVHPWEGAAEDNYNSVFSFQLFDKGLNPFIGYQAFAKCTNKSDKHTANEFVTFTKTDAKNEDGDVIGTIYTCDLCGKSYYHADKEPGNKVFKNLTSFDKLTQKQPSTGNSYYRIYKIKDGLGSNGNTMFRLVMQGTGNAGYWGDMELYECDEKGNILSNNILINGDFSLGEIGWTIAPSDNFNYRVVEQPDNFFKNYRKNGTKMITSAGTLKNALLGQTVEVERGKTYYFSGFYVNMNAAGITPKIMYKTVDGKTVAANVELFYDPDRFFFEIAFTLPDDAYSNRGKTTVDFVLDNTGKGKGYISDLAVYEEGKYTNLFKNADFKSGFKNWINNSNYKLSAYDSSVFVFYYDDSKFDDGDWSGTAHDSLINGSISGRVIDGEGNVLKGAKVTLKPVNKTVTTNASGSYSFTNIAPGEYSLYITTPDGKTVFITKVTVTSGMVTTLSDITVALENDGGQDDQSIEETYEEQDFYDEPDFDLDDIDSDDFNLDDIGFNYGVVCGYLFDADGNPLKGQKLYLGDVGTVVTKAKGVFQFNEVPPGEYDIYTKLEDGSIHIFKRVKVVAGKGSIYKLRMPDNGNSMLWWIILIAAGGVLILGGGTALLIVFLKRKKK